jgi:ferritin-like metal-binding protein YciE
MSSATELIIDQLREAEAVEQSSISLLQSHLRGAPPGPYRAALRRHLDETRRHAHQVGERLTDLGATRGPLSLALTLGEAVIGRVAGVALAPLELLAGRSTPDVLLRHVQEEIASEAREGATYVALERLAAAAGDQTTASLARAIRADEERYLESLRESLGAMADRVARARLGTSPEPASTPEPEPDPTPAPRTPRPQPVRAATGNGGPVAEAEPRHVTRGVTQVETEGAADPGAEVHVDAPWDGYDQMKAADVVARVKEADDATRAIVRLYEAGNKGRKSVLDATG